jgi:hypothetical protein
MVIRRAGAGWWALAIIAVIATTCAVLLVSVQVGLLILGVLIALLANKRSSVLILIVAMIPTLSLLRRLVAGELAYRDSDPLILLPLILTIGVVLVSWTRVQVDRRTDLVRLFAGATIVGVAVAIVLRGAFSVDTVFFAGLIAIPLLLAIAVSTKQLADIWPTVERVIPWIALAVGIYGVIQFFVLPVWDSAWMVSSRLQSIGQPYPQQVRVFGASESPGPYAIFMGISLTVTLGLAVISGGMLKKFGWIVASIAIVFPLVLSGVRSALLGVVICVALLALTRAKGITRVVLIAFLIGGYQLLTIVISRFGGQSAVLSTDRYSDLANDVSLLARLSLFSNISNPLQFLVGNPSAPVADNLYIDVLVRYGLLPAVGLLALFIAVAVRAYKLLRRHQNETAALSVWFLLSQSMFVNFFNSLVGILVGILIGSIMARRPSPRDHLAPQVGSGHLVIPHPLLTANSTSK